MSTEEDRPARNVSEDDALRLILESTVAETGSGFLRELVRNLCRALQTKGAWVTEYLADRRRLRALAFWYGEGWIEDYEYAVDGTPCRPVIDACSLAHFPEGVVELFPDDPDLPGLEAVSYMGVPLLEADGSILGHLALIDTRPLVKDEKVETIFRVFAERATAEVRRLRAETEIRRREEQLSRLIDSAMDGVLVLNDDLRIARANPAVARVLGTKADELPGLELGRFLDEESADEIAGRCREMADRPPEQRRLWFPRGLSARRADGTPFAVEATLSGFESGAGVFYTLIVRDVNERLEAEKRLSLLADEADYYRQAAGEAPGGGQIIGKSPGMRRLFEAMKQVAATDATVLILGETGTGKELIAHAIRSESARARGPFVRVNCAAIPGTLIESELFGHERGAFTGATTRREGRFALADGGTIFLDEVGELPLELQPKLLRVLQEGEFEPLGSTRTRKVGVRAIAATHRDLEAMVREGTFREDLYYRLNVFPLRVPPLRERLTDVPLLAEALAQRFARRMGRRIEPLGPAEVQRLKAYSWPGNVRELQNVIERALILSRGPRVELERAMPTAGGEAALGSEEGTPEPGPDRVLTAHELRELERANIRRALEISGWKVSGKDGAARVLGLPVSTLTSRMKALRIRRPRGS